MFRHLYLGGLGLLLAGLSACGGGGGATPAPQPATASFKNLTLPAGGFPVATASIQSTTLNASTVARNSTLPKGYDDPNVYTWINVSYADAQGVAKTLAILRWVSFAKLGDTGLRLELPSGIGALQYQVYNANGTAQGSITL